MDSVCAGCTLLYLFSVQRNTIFVGKKVQRIYKKVAMTYDPERVINLGDLEKRGKTVRFGIKEKDRSRHVYVIGQTGTGKSTLLEMMAMQDLKNGTGLIFLDPHGQSVDNLLQYVTQDHLDDVIYFAPHLQEKPIGLNIMEDIGYDKRHLVVSSLMASFEKIWGAATWSDRMAYILSNTLLALIEYPGTTLLDVGRMYSSKSYREKVVANIKDPQVKKYWTEEYANYTERYAQEATPSIQNKLGQFTSNPLMRNIIGQKKSAFDFRQIMDEGKMLLVNLSKGQIGENNARMLGVLFTTKIYLAALSRSDVTKAELEAARPCNFFVDEFQSFANSSFSDILSEARKYKLNLVLAHQYLGQLYTDDTGGGNAIRDAVFGNVGTFVSFRVGPVDAEIIAKQFAPNIAEEDLVALPRYHVYLTLNIDGAGSPPFSARTFYEPASEAESMEDEVIKKTMDTYGIDREIVENEVRENIEEDERENQADKKKQGKAGQQRQNRNQQTHGKQGEEKTHMPLKGLVDKIRQEKPKAAAETKPENIKKQEKRQERITASSAEKSTEQKQAGKKQNEETDKNRTSLNKPEREGQEIKKPDWSKLFRRDKKEEQESTKQMSNAEIMQPSASPVRQQQEDKEKTQNKKERNPQHNEKPVIQKKKHTHSRQGNDQPQHDKNPQKPAKTRHDKKQNNDSILKQAQGVFGEKMIIQTTGQRQRTAQNRGNNKKQNDNKLEVREQRDKNKVVQSAHTRNKSTVMQSAIKPPQNKNNNEDNRQEIKNQDNKSAAEESNKKQNSQDDSQQQGRVQGNNGKDLGNLVKAARASGFKKSLKVEPKKEKEAPPINYEEGWVSIGDLSTIPHSQGDE